MARGKQYKSLSRYGSLDHIGIVKERKSVLFGANKGHEEISKLRSTGMCCLIVSCVRINVSREPCISIFKEQEREPKIL
jgi:hypothetical protein